MNIYLFKSGDEIGKIENGKLCKKIVTDIVDRPHCTIDAYKFSDGSELSIDFANNSYILLEELKINKPEYFL